MYVFQNQTDHFGQSWSTDNIDWTNQNSIQIREAGAKLHIGQTKYNYIAYLANWSISLISILGGRLTKK